MIRKAFFAIAALGLFAAGVNAQEQSTEQWSLEQCINYAHENNITIKRQQLNVEYRQNQLKQSKYDMLPDLNADLSARLSYGLSWDPVKKDNYDQTSHNVTPSLSSRASLFEGLSKKKAVQKEKYNLLSAEEDIKKVENDIMLSITRQYLQILFDKELLNVAKEQHEVSKLQMERTKKLVDAGSQAMGSFLEIKSQAAKEALNVTQQENNLGISILNLAQLLDLESPIGFDVQSPTIPEMGEFTPDLPRSIYATAVEIMPEIKSSEYGVESKENELMEVKGSYYPKLYLSGGWNSGAYYSEGGEDNKLFTQLKDNRQYYMGLTLSIPIFNKFRVRTGVQNTQISLNDARFKLEADKLTLRKEIQQAYADALASYKKYLASEEAVDSYKESFRYTEKKFNVGLVNSVDYNVAKTDFTRAQSDLLQAKYEYVLRTKILDFYRGIPIQL